MSLRVLLSRTGLAVILIASLVVTAVVGISHAQANTCEDLPHTKLTKSVPSDGKYYLWMLTKKDSASAKTYASVGGQDCQVLGSPEGSNWEWVSGSDGLAYYQLSAGSNEVRLLVDSGSIFIDKVLLTSDKDCIPNGDGGNCIEAPLEFDINGLSSGEIVSGTKVVSADVSSPVQGASVKFLIDDTEISLQSASPYCLVLTDDVCGGYDFNHLSPGDHRLTVVATTDAGQGLTKSVVFKVADESIPVPNPEPNPEPELPENQSLSVSIVGINPGQVINGKISVNSIVSGNTAVARVTYKIDTTKVSFTTEAPYCMIDGPASDCGEWDTNTLKNGNYTLHVIVESDGADTSWTSVPFTVDNAPAVTAPETTEDIPPEPESEAVLGNSNQVISGIADIKLPPAKLKPTQKVTYSVDGREVQTEPSVSSDGVRIDTNNLDNGKRVLSARISLPNGEEQIVSSTVGVSNSLFSKVRNYVSQNPALSVIISVVIVSSLVYVLVMIIRSNSSKNLAEVSSSTIFRVAALVFTASAAVMGLYLQSNVVGAAGLGFVAEAEDGLPSDYSVFTELSDDDGRIYVKATHTSVPIEDPEEHNDDYENHTPPTPEPDPESTACTPGPVVTMGLCLKPEAVATSAQGAFVPRQVQQTGYAPEYYDGVGAFRTECWLSHTSKDDPIVFPGRDGAAHWHQFFGNTAADENLTNPAATGGSTCMGGTLNRTAYWAPALVDTSSYNSDTKEFDIARPMSLPDGIALQVYYKAGYEGVVSSTIEAFPAGLRMIAGGDPSRTPTGPAGRRVRFDCISWGHAQSIVNNIYDRNSIPADCPPGNYIQARVQFPQCGAEDARGNPLLDSPNHRDHMAYPLGWPDLGCPASHPRAYPEIIEHFRWKIPVTGAAGLRFSSDMYSLDQPGGWTFHADWWNGWETSTFQSIIDNCFHGSINGSPTGIDCRMNLTGTRHPNGGWWMLDGNPQ